MKLTGIFHRSELKAIERGTKTDYDEMTVSNEKLNDLTADGWELQNSGKRKSRVKRRRSIDRQLEISAWRLLYSLKFDRMSSTEGALVYQSESVYDQVDVVAYDEEAAIVIECKSAEQAGKKLNMQSEISQLSFNRDTIRSILNRDKQSGKLKVGAILVVQNISVSATDYERAKEAKVLILDIEDLNYYAKLEKLIGEATRYQFLGEVFAGQEIDGLTLKVPAVQSRMGDRDVYTFAISPAQLLKIGFVAHRMRNSLGSYQRLVQANRLKDIVKYIDEGGVFPTNVVINFAADKNGKTSVRFEAGAKVEGVESVSRMGYLILPRKYQSAWIIDGQHRLFAYSGHKWSNKESLSVLAFDGLEPNEQAELFVSINSKQKKVKASHLHELFATLKWGSTNEKERVSAIVSKLIQDWRSNSGSFLSTRILLTDEEKSDNRCLTVKALADAIARMPFLISKASSKGDVKQFGVLWAGNSDTTYKRLKDVLEAWISTLRDHAPKQWALGDHVGGILATNRGMTAAIKVLSDVLDHLQDQGEISIDSTVTEISDLIYPYSVKAGEWFESLDESSSSKIRQHYGAGAPAEIVNRINETLALDFEGYEPKGLADWKLSRETSKIEETKKIVDDLERRVQEHIFEVLKGAFGEEEDEWWPEIPVKVRKEAVARREEDPDRNSLDKQLMLIDYRTIVEEHWELFEKTLAFPKSGKKTDRTKWFVDWNNIRNKCSHAAGLKLKPEDNVIINEINDELKLRGV